VKAESKDTLEEIARLLQAMLPAGWAEMQRSVEVRVFVQHPGAGLT
jgi:hypothetical protein